MPATKTDTGAPPKPLLIVAAVLALGLAVAVGVLGLTKGSEEPAPGGPGPLALSTVPAPDAGGPACAALLPALPAELASNGATLPRRELAQPAPPATVAWGQQEPVVLRCGLERPAEFAPDSQLRVINAVTWLQVPGAGTATWYVVDRGVFIALTVPDNAGTGPLQDVANAVGKTIPPVK